MPNVPAGSLLPLAGPHGGVFRLAGPRPEQAADAVRPLIPLGAALGVVQHYLGAVAGPDGSIAELLDVPLVLDASTTAAPPVVTSQASLRALHEHALRGSERDTLGTADQLVHEKVRLAPLLYCRKRHVLIAARSPRSGQPLDTNPEATGGDGLAPELVASDGSDVRFGAAGGESGGRPVESLESMVRAQGEVAALARGMRERDPLGYLRIAAEHTCCECVERERCYPSGDRYAYCLDRMAVVNAAPVPLLPRRIGEWSWEDAGALLGGRTAGELLARPHDAGLLRAAQDASAARLAALPRFLMSGEPDGRDLLECARVKLGLCAAALRQLEAAWRQTSRPHLCWDADTLRVAWRPPGTTPAAAWGFSPTLRNVGLQPPAQIEVLPGDELPAPPVFCDAALLPVTAQVALRHFGESRKATILVKMAAPPRGREVPLKLIVENLGIAREYFFPGDRLYLTDGRWEGHFEPAATFDPNDGAGLTIEGAAAGNTDKLKPTAELRDVTCIWYPRFGEAVDLHAMALLGLSLLLAHDERTPAQVWEAAEAELRELAAALGARPAEQREAAAREWIAGRAADDGPAALWSRRGLWHARSARAAARPDALPAAAWEQCLTLFARLALCMPGFGYCDHRGRAAPRTPSGALLPLVELQGQIALLDDLLFARRGALESCSTSLGQLVS